MEIIFNSAGIENAAKEFIEFTSNHNVFAFTGDLGAGKTTFINAVCKQLGVTETVTSPTFAIIQEYYSKEKGSICHMDLYRIKNIEEAIEAGVEDYLLGNSICMVEWPEKATLLFPPLTVFTTLLPLSDNSRKLIVQLPQ